MTPVRTFRGVPVSARMVHVYVLDACLLSRAAARDEDPQDSASSAECAEVEACDAAKACRAWGAP